MQKGVIALLDILGFKGMWARKSEDEIIKQWREIRKTLDTWLEATIPYAKEISGDTNFEMDSYMFSDTIIITVTTEVADEDRITPIPDKIEVDAITDLNSINTYAKGHVFFQREKYKKYIRKKMDKLLD